MATAPATNDPGEQRARVRILEARLADVDRAKGLWTEYVEALRGLVQLIETDQYAVFATDSAFLNSLAALDPLRLRAKNALYAVNPNIPTYGVFEGLLQHNLSTQAPMMLAFISGETEGGGAVVTTYYLNARTVECDAVIDRFRNEVAAELLAARAYAEEGGRGAVSVRALLAKWRRATEKNWLARACWWLFADHIKLVIAGVVLAALAAAWAAIR